MENQKKPEVVDGVVREPVSGWIHSAGIPLSVIGLAVLEFFAVKNQSAWQAVSFAVFGVCLALVYTFSTLYHLLHLKPFGKKIFQHLDRTMIYLLIAGTYTPVCLLVLRNAWGWSLFGVVWGLAGFGIISRWLIRSIPSFIHPVLYVIMGWLALIAIRVIWHSLPLYGVWLLIGGGIAYTLGVVFFVLEELVPRRRKFDMHEIFHLFVFAGSVSHFLLMFFIATKIT